MATNAVIGKAGLGPVEPRVVAADEARFLQPLDPFHDGGAGEADLVGDGLVAGAAVGGEELEDAAGGGVERLSVMGSPFLPRRGNLYTAY